MKKRKIELGVLEAVVFAIITSCAYSSSQTHSYPTKTATMDGTMPNRRDSFLNPRKDDNINDVINDGNDDNINDVINDGPYQSLTSVQTPLTSVDGLNFPSVLHRMLKCVDDNSAALAEIVSWQPHGRCFRVHRVREFVQLFLNR
jgi:hypothetical protein